MHSDINGIILLVRSLYYSWSFTTKLSSTLIHRRNLTYAMQMKCISTRVLLHVVHQAGTENKEADTLSRRTHVDDTLNCVSNRLSETMHYAGDKDFKCDLCQPIKWRAWEAHLLSIHDGYLFQSTQLCLPSRYIRQSVLQDLCGGHSKHFGRDKTNALSEDCFFWPKMKTDVAWTCQISLRVPISKSQK